MPYIEFKQTYQSWEDNRIYKAGEIVDVDHDNFLELTSIGVADVYIEPIKPQEVIPNGTTVIQFIRTTKDYKCGSIVELDNKKAYSFIKSGCAVAAEKESTLNTLLKSIYKMNREELLLFAEEHNIKIEIEWKNETLIRKIIEMNLIMRGEDS